MARQLGFTVFIVDDDPGVLRGLSRLLNASCFETRCFANPREFLIANDPLIPGCAIIDLSLGEIDGLQLQEMLIESGHERPVIFLTGTGDIPSSVKAMKAGAIDFLTKPIDRSALLDAVGKAAEADARARQRQVEMQAIERRIATLTRREHEVMQHVVAGRLNKQIAASLGTVEKTIKVHRARMMTKLGVRCVADLVRMAERVGIPPSQAAR